MPRKSVKARKTAALRLKRESLGPEPRKFRDPARVAAAKQEFEKWVAEQGVERADLDKKIAENQARIDAMRANQDEKEKTSGSLNLDEQILILQAHFEHGIGVKLIAGQLGRNHSVVSRFLSKYKSTATLAKMHLLNSAERIARRVVRGANIEESLEVLDRLDVLPKKDRGKTTDGGNHFQVIVGMPSQSPAGPVVPTQAAIEAALVKSEPVNGN